MAVNIVDLDEDRLASQSVIATVLDMSSRHYDLSRSLYFAYTRNLIVTY